MRFRTLLICIVFALPVIAGFAQEAKQPAVTQQAPDPANLVNDWWTWLGDAPLEERASRISVFEQRLDARSNSLTDVDDGKTRAQNLLVELKSLLKAFAEDAIIRQRLKTQPPAVAQPADAGPYSVEKLLDLSVTRLESALELERTTRELNEQDTAVDAARQRASDALADYIAKGSQAPERLLDGLNIIRLRLLWALGVAELERLQSAKSRVEKEHQAIIAAIERGSSNLTASEAELARWAAQLADSQRAGSQSDTTMAESHLRTTAFADDTLGRIQRRRLQQQLLDLEAQRALATLQHAEAELALDLANAALGTLPDLQTLRAHENALDEAVSTINKQVTAWRKATEQERTSANEIQNLDADAQPLVVVNRARIKQVDATAQTLIAINRQTVRAELLLKLARTQIVAQGGQVGQLTAQAGEGLRQIWTQIQDFSTHSLFTINDTPVTTLGLLRFTVIVLVAWFASRLARKGFAHLSTRRQNMNQASIYTLSRLFHYVILTLGFFVAFSSIGIDFTKFALIASAFGVGLGFGLQAIFSNFVAGLIILFERSLKVGDFVELESGVTGEVQSVNIRSTMITTNDNIDILVPNSEFVNGRVTNWTLREAHRRVRIPFGVAYGTNKDQVKLAALEASDEVSHTLQTAGREPQVWLVNFGESSLDFELVVWLKPESVKRPGAVNAAYTWAIESALSRYGIEIPFPQRDLHVRSAFGHKDEDGPKLLASISDIKSQSRNQPQREPTDD